MQFLLRAHEEFVQEEVGVVVGVLCLGECRAVEVVLGAVRHGAEWMETTSKDDET